MTNFRPSPLVFRLKKSISHLNKWFRPLTKKEWQIGSYFVSFVNNQAFIT
jgi:hypothetical protein